MMYHHILLNLHSLFVSTTEKFVQNFVGNLELETSDNDDAMYNSDVKKVDCTNLICNKRISNKGQERSAGRPGNRPIGAREAAQNFEACLGPYATRDCVQSLHTGHNTHDDEQASSRRPRED